MTSYQNNYYILGLIKTMHLPSHKKVNTKIETSNRLRETGDESGFKN